MPSNVIRRALGLCLASALLVFAIAPPERVSADAATTVILPISTTFFVSCAGENVTLTGELHIVNHFVSDANGGFHGTFNSHSAGLRGYGEITGNQYIGHSRTFSSSYTSEDGAPSNSTFVFNFIVDGNGKGKKFMVTNHIHFTTNANGETTAQIVDTEFNCQ